MRQWQECKQKASGALLLFRLGDFYEAFHADAQILSKEVSNGSKASEGTVFGGLERV